MAAILQELTKKCRCRGTVNISEIDITKFSCTLH